jgi:CHAD domain-containing protein
VRAADGVRAGEDVEAVHDLRVAIRRLRAVLRAAPAFFDEEWADGVQEELERLGPALGPLRDLDVFTERVREESEEFSESDRAALDPVFAALASDREAAQQAAVAELDAPAFAELAEVLATPQFADADTSLGDVEERELRRLRKTVRQIDDDAPDELLHRARIRAKRLRYVAEANEDDTVAKRAKKLQDVAGEHQDAVVAEDKLRALAERVPTASLQLGRLVERECERREEQRSGFSKAWRKLEKAASTT